MQDYLLSLIRTVVPVGVGAFVAWLASLGVDAGATANTGLVIGVTGLVIGAYYALVRAIEPKLPAFLRALLIGAARTPTYAPAAPSFVPLGGTYQSRQ
jgi:uncharacterized membrane protein (DUF441 family)